MSTKTKSDSWFIKIFHNWWEHYADSFWFILLPILLGGCVVLSQTLLDRRMALMWAMAFAAVGSLVGLIFGIPKVVVSESESADQEQDSKPSGKSKEQQKALLKYIPNGNLENISDWLSKTLVGIGLIEMREVPGMIRQLAIVVVGDPSDLSAISMATAIIILFSSMGFVGGYINTRIYFGQSFRKVEGNPSDN